MGRKKIEIRPLNDERNRNVTFLKRKAGLMKKAWELSVLCAADVSILIFSAAGKAYEFSSKDIDDEIDKYLDYEGLIERRRAPEFAAAALAGEDDEEDDDDDARRGSTSKAAGSGAPKSLKGKESFKSRMTSRAEMSRAITKAKERRGKGKAGRRRRRTVATSGERQSFIDGILDSDEESSDESEFDAYGQRQETIEERRRRKRRDERGSHEDPMGGMQYAMNLHQHPASSSNPEVMSNYFARGQLAPSLPRQSVSESWRHPDVPQHHASYSVPPYQPQQDVQYPPPMAQEVPPGLPAGMQWNQDLLARYAEFQLQQNHQRQQRILLERQRVQLQELGIPIEDKGLLDQLFGTGPSGSSQAQSSGDMSISNGVAPEAFEWPSVNQLRGSPMPIKDLNEGYPGMMDNSLPHGEVDIPWGIGTATEDHMPFASPASPGVDDRLKRERAMYEDMNAQKRMRL